MVNSGRTPTYNTSSASFRDGKEIKLSALSQGTWTVSCDTTIQSPLVSVALVVRLDKLKVSVDGDNVCDHACTAMMGIAAEPSSGSQ